MDPQLIGWIGGIFGSLVGVAGGVAGTLASISSTKGPRERAFMVRVATAAWVAVVAFVAAVCLTPPPYQYWLWLPYAVALPVGIWALNRRHAQIRAEEAPGIQ